LIIVTTEKRQPLKEYPAVRDVKKDRRRRSYVTENRMALAAGVATRSGGDRKGIAQRSQKDARNRVFEMLGEYLSKTDKLIALLGDVGFNQEQSTPATQPKTTSLRDLIAAWKAAERKYVALMGLQFRDTQLSLEEEIGTELHKQMKLEDQMLTTPATDLAGLLGKLGIALSYPPEFMDGTPRKLIEAVKRDLEAMTLPTAAAPLQ
jgi:hypothetical protein